MKGWTYGQTDGWTCGRTILSCIRMIHVLTKFYYPWCSTIKLHCSQLALTVYSPTFIVHDCMPRLLYFSFMRDFKRKGHPSLLDNLKTHNKFPLIETFLETITEKSNKVGCCLYMSAFRCFSHFILPPSLKLTDFWWTDCLQSSLFH